MTSLAVSLYGIDELPTDRDDLMGRDAKPGNPTMIYKAVGKRETGGLYSHMGRRTDATIFLPRCDS